VRRGKRAVRDKSHRSLFFDSLRVCCRCGKTQGLEGHHVNGLRYPPHANDYRMIMVCGPAVDSGSCHNYLETHGREVAEFEDEMVEATLRLLYPDTWEEMVERAQR